MNEDMKIGYNIACQRLKEELDDMVAELRKKFFSTSDGRIQDKLNAQIQILLMFKEGIENAIADGE